MNSLTVKTHRGRRILLIYMPLAVIGVFLLVFLYFWVGRDSSSWDPGEQHEIWIGEPIMGESTIQYIKSELARRERVEDSEEYRDEWDIGMLSWQQQEEVLDRLVQRYFVLSLGDVSLSDFANDDDMQDLEPLIDGMTHYELRRLRRALERYEYHYRNRVKKGIKG